MGRAVEGGTFIQFVKEHINLAVYLVRTQDLPKI